MKLMPTGHIRCMYGLSTNFTIDVLFDNTKVTKIDIWEKDTNSNAEISFKRDRNGMICSVSMTNNITDKDVQKYVAKIIITLCSIWRVLKMKMKIKLLSKIADRIFAKHGWKKVKENEIVIAYEQYRPDSNYTARVEIAHHKYHPNTVCCYDTTNIKGPDYYSPSVGMDGIIMWATLLKMIGVGFLPDPEAKKKTPWGEDASRSYVIKAERGGMSLHEFNKLLFGYRRCEGDHE